MKGGRPAYRPHYDAVQSKHLNPVTLYLVSTARKQLSSYRTDG